MPDIEPCKKPLDIPPWIFSVHGFYCVLRGTTQTNESRARPAQSEISCAWNRAQRENKKDGEE